MHRITQIAKLRAEMKAKEEALVKQHIARASRALEADQAKRRRAFDARYADDRAALEARAPQV